MATYVTKYPNSLMKKATKILASPTNKFLCCKTCGKITDFFQIREGFAQRESIPSRRKKTWQRVIKGKTLHQKVYFSYVLMDCIEAKHKLEVKTKPFYLKKGDK